MNLDFIREPAMFERAFGPKWGFRIWRGLIMLFVVCAFGGAVFGAFHGYAKLRSDFTSLESSSVEKGATTVVQTTLPALSGSIVGNDNTVVGPPRTIEGSGNTIVGPMDGSTNTMSNQGGTAIGAGACADRTSVAIGAGANAGACAGRK